MSGDDRKTPLEVTFEPDGSTIAISGPDIVPFSVSGFHSGTDVTFSIGDPSKSALLRFLLIGRVDRQDSHSFAPDRWPVPAR